MYIRAALTQGGTVGSNFFVLFFIFFVRFNKKIKNGPIADWHVSVESANSTKTLPDSLLAEEEEGMSFIIFVGPTSLKTS